MFGEIAPKMLGKINTAEFSLDSLNLTAGYPLYNAPQAPLTLNIPSAPSTATTSIRTNIYPNSAGASICLDFLTYNGGSSGTQSSRIQIVDDNFGNDFNFISRIQGSDSNGYQTNFSILANRHVTTANNTLDDSNGNMTISGNFTPAATSIINMPTPNPARINSQVYELNGYSPSQYDYYSTLYATGLLYNVANDTSGLATPFTMQSDGTNVGFAAMKIGWRNINFYAGTSAPSSSNLPLTDSQFLSYGVFSIASTSITASQLLTANAGLTVSGATNINTAISAGVTNIGNTSNSLTLYGSPIGIATGNSISTVVNIGTGSNYNGVIHIADGTGASGISIGNNSAPSSTTILGQVIINNGGVAAIQIGGGTYAGQITISNSGNSNPVICNNGLTINDSITPLALIVNQSVTSTTTLRLQVSGIAKYDIVAGNTTGAFKINNSTGAAILQQSSSSDLSLMTQYNTLDDGSANMIINAQDVTNPNCLRITRAGTTNHLRTRIIFDPNNSIGSSWEMGTDPSTNGTNNFYLYSATLGDFLLQATTTGYVTAGKGFPWGKTTVTTPSTGSQTISAAAILGGIVLSPVQTSAYTWTTDTGTNLYSAMGSPAVGTTVQCLWSNDNNAGGAVMTIAFGSGVSGNLRGDTLTNNQSMVIYFRCTGTNTFTCYS